MKPITVLLSDDHTIVRQGLRLLLDAAADIQVVGEAENGRQAVAETERLLPDIVLLDFAMPILNGVEATRQIIKALPAAKVLILSSYSGAQHVRQAIEAGAAGYVMKETAGNELLDAIREVHIGNAFFSPLLLKSLFQRHQASNSRAQPTNGARLSIRQMEILQLIAEGYVTKQIAALLAITKKTVEKHRQALMDKLDIHGIADLTRYAYSCGVVEINRVLEPESPGTSITRRLEHAAPPQLAVSGP
jgi:DNA-binding NarL/FixJ family response regulator